MKHGRHRPRVINSSRMEISPCVNACTRDVQAVQVQSNQQVRLIQTSNTKKKFNSKNVSANCTLPGVYAVGAGTTGQPAVFGAFQILQGLRPAADIINDGRHHQWLAMVVLPYYQHHVARIELAIGVRGWANWHPLKGRAYRGRRAYL